MTGELLDLAPIRERDAGCVGFEYAFGWDAAAIRDRRALLAEVDRLTAERDAALARAKKADRLRRAHYCGCGWCCGSMPPEAERGEAHRNCPAAKGGAS